MHKLRRLKQLVIRTVRYVRAGLFGRDRFSDRQADIAQRAYHAARAALSLQASFDWSESAEGFHYWNEVFERLQSIETSAKLLIVKRRIK
jgi:hypothetical protein